MLVVNASISCGQMEQLLFCGYCGCLPTRHSKKDARYPSDSIAGTSPEKWKDKDLGCNGSRS